jgi:hypothetical protein
MNILQFLYDHWPTVSGWMIAAYIHICREGGLRTILIKFMGPKQPPQAMAETKITP